MVDAAERWLLEEACESDTAWSQRPVGGEQMLILVETNSVNVEIGDGQKLVVQNNPLEHAEVHPANKGENKIIINGTLK